MKTFEMKDVSVYTPDGVKCKVVRCLDIDGCETDVVELLDVIVVEHPIEGTITLQCDGEPECTTEKTKLPRQ